MKIHWTGKSNFTLKVSLCGIYSSCPNDGHQWQDRCLKVQQGKYLNTNTPDAFVTPDWFSSLTWVVHISFSICNGMENIWKDFVKYYVYMLKWTITNIEN